MEAELGQGGGLNPILVAVSDNDRLRFEIRDHRFNVYYGGGNLLLVDGRKRTWALRFDKMYFEGGAFEPPCLPAHYSTLDDSQVWVNAIPALMDVMDDWWTRNPKDERTHCQAMATTNSAKNGLPQTDYLVLDLEYQWAQRRFDLIAAKRRMTEQDPTGWVEPDLVFVEVKSDYRACSRKSGLGDHARDYRDIITARSGQSINDIKIEYQNVIVQKQCLELLHKSIPFKRFSAAVPELLVVIVDLDQDDSRLLKPLTEVMNVSNELGRAACIRRMKLDSNCYEMTASKYF